MKNKDKKVIRFFGEFKMISYRCNRCGMLIWNKSWKGDTHKNCDEWFAKKELMDNAEGKALKKL